MQEVDATEKSLELFLVCFKGRDKQRMCSIATVRSDHQDDESHLCNRPEGDPQSGLAIYVKISHALDICCPALHLGQGIRQGRRSSQENIAHIKLYWFSVRSKFGKAA